MWVWVSLRLKEWAVEEVGCLQAPVHTLDQMPDPGSYHASAPDAHLWGLRRLKTRCALFLNVHLATGKLEVRVSLLWLVHMTSVKGAGCILP